ncbi:MAG: hypothetical protein WDM94_09275 [Bauldia sp.]
MALTADRNTPRAEGDLRQGGLAAAVVVFAGALVMRNSSGYLTKGAAATGAVGVGRAGERKTGGANAGDEALYYQAGIFRFDNSTSGDLIATTDVGKPCYVVDDAKVAKTDGSGTRSIAGFIDGVDSQGVWVRFDEVLARAYVAGVTLPEAD